MSKKVSDRLRSALNFVNCGSCGCHRDRNIRRTVDPSKKPIKRTSKRISKDNFAVISSADEKLRSLGHRSQSSPKSNTYCGPQTEKPATSRSEPPDIPPPPVPKSISVTSLPNQTNGLDNESSNVVNQSIDEDKAPPLLPRTVKLEMAERRVSQYNRRDGNEKSAKRRSRSEGPHGRRRARNSMHETSNNQRNQVKATTPGRHSMYTGNRSDEEIVAKNSGSESENTEDDIQKWTKNPLLVKRSSKSDRDSKVENRKSTNSLENGFSKECRGYSPSRAQKAKFQRMEANRRKRIDMQVTSDEECSPQLRISRLRQRAMMSSKLFEENSSKSELNIIPQRSENVFDQIDERVGRQSDERPVSQYSFDRLSKYDENDNLNLNGHIGRQLPIQIQSERTKTNKIKLPEYIPIAHEGMSIPVKAQNVPSQTVVHRNQNSGNFIKIETKNEKGSSNQSSARVKLSSESPKLRSFQEVKPSQPAAMKKAIGKIELNQRPANSSSDDSLDELIESNIQYLESEIESGKLKRQSGNFANAAPEVTIIQPKVIREPLKKQSTVNDEFRSRLQMPSSVSSPSLVTPYYSNTNVYTDPYGQSQFANTQKTSNQIDYRHIRSSGSATYSPHMKRRTCEYTEDVSKSDTQLNALDTNFIQNKPNRTNRGNIVPFPVLNTQTGNIVYIQPEIAHSSNLENKSLSAPSMDAGMFSDVEYNIEVSERIKKWEKKIGPETESKQRNILKTIQEYETFAESIQDDSVPDTPVEIRRELRQLLSSTNTSGTGKLSVSLTRSTSSISDSTTPEAGPALTYFEPKVVSSETNLHRIFRVVNEPKQKMTDRSSEITPASSTTSFTAAETPIVGVQRRRKHGTDQTSRKQITQSLNNMALSESEIGNNSQQTWPPMTVDSDSGVRKSWRISRYEDEINELKELVADNFRDLRKRFDSDISESDSRRGSSPARLMTVTPSETSNQTSEQGNVPVTLNIQTVTPTRIRSPAIIRRALAKKQEKSTTSPVSPNVPQLTPKPEKKPLTISVGSRATPPISKQEPQIETKLADVWSPSMESGKGLISIERVKARTLQTIPFSEDPVWKEIEGLTAFDKADDSPNKINFDDIDALLELATKGTDRAVNNSSHGIMATSFTQSYSTLDPFKSNQMKQRKLSDSALAMPESEKRKVFNPPQIQPLKLNAAQIRKSSTSALDEVLEDIRVSLEKKPLSPKLMRNLDTAESNSSANNSLVSPLSRSTKAFIFPKDKRTFRDESVIQKQDSYTPGYDNTQASWQLQQKTNAQGIAPKPGTELPYVDPEFTQFPYIINGNYHLDPDLLSEKLISTGLVSESSSQNKTPNVSGKSGSKQVNGVHTKTKDIKPTHNGNQSSFPDIDQSVVELKSLAQEVETKLSQIKSRIVSADEGKLDSVLLALRKFAPMTEQKYFNVSYGTSEKHDNLNKRGKLEDALSELEKIYESLDLDDKNLMDRASRQEEIPQAYRTNRNENIERKVTSVQFHKPALPPQKRIHRKSQIDEVERQTQNEFEDITKSFQVLLDEVTKQCKSVARGSVNFYEGQPPITLIGSGQFSTQPPANVIHHEPPRQQLKPASQSQRGIQDSYNVAIKELESVATGNSNNLNSKSMQSTVYVNMNQRINQNKDEDNKQKFKGMNIRLQSRENKQLIDNKNNTSNFVSMVTEFKPTLATPVNLSRNTSSSDSESEGNNGSKRVPKRSNSKGRFRRKGTSNPEHRKSMPASMRTVETQTIETQTDGSIFDQVNPLTDIKSRRKSNGHMPDTKQDIRGFPVKRKLSSGIAKMVDMFSSSDDEIYRGKLKHSHSAPDLVDLFEGFDKAGVIKSYKIDKQLNKDSPKVSTPRSVKNRHEAKSRYKSLPKVEMNLKTVDKSAMSPNMKSPPVFPDNNIDSRVSKPPVYPVWQYPGQADSTSPRKAEKRMCFGFDRELHINASDNETERAKSGGSKFSAEIVRRRIKSDGEEDESERPKSFHELMAAFESDPERLEKIRKSGLRKCASEESMFIDLVLQRMYPSAMCTENNASRGSSKAEFKLSSTQKGEV